MTVTIHTGDCLAVMRTLADNSVDSIVTDPPYGLEFMGKEWDAPWRATSGGFSSPGIGDRETAWPSYLGSNRVRCGSCGKLVGQGGSPCPCVNPMPVSSDAQRMQAFQAWCEVWAREALRIVKPGGHLLSFGGSRTYHRMASAIEDAGWQIRDQIMWIYGSGFPKSHNGAWGGTALKPGHEPIVVARKPLMGTVAVNFATHGVGGLNIDACRIGWPNGAVPEIGTPGWGGPAKTLSAAPGISGEKVARTPPSQLGRWPANVIHDGSDQVLAAFPNAPGQQGDLKGHSRDRISLGIYGDMHPARDAVARGDTGSAARFFYCAKATASDREAGLAGFAKVASGMVSNTSGQHITRRDEGYEPPQRANHHPTVKPTELMRYLVRLVTPTGGVVLDPFTGSGSTGRGAVLEDLSFVGIELDPEYVAIAAARIADAERERAGEKTAAVEAARQTDLFKEQAA